MARIAYDEPTAESYRAVREVAREGLAEWREAIRRHLRPAPGTTVLDLGAGTGQFTSALVDWFGLEVVAVEPSEAMRAQIHCQPGVSVLAGDAGRIPLPDDTVDGAWLSLMLHHVPDVPAAARELRRVLRPGAPVLIRQGFRGRYYERIENVRWFPETGRLLDTYPGLEETIAAFEPAGFALDGLEQVPETYSASLATYLSQLDTLRRADTTLRSLTEEEFQRGKERIRAALRHSPAEPRTNSLDLLILR